MKLKLTTFLLVLSATFTFGQGQMTVDEDVRPMSKGEFPSFSIEIPQSDLKTIDKDWKKYLSMGSKAKLLEVNGEVIMPGAVSKNVSVEPFNVYSKLLETNTGVRVTAWFNFKDSVYISKQLNNDMDMAAQKYILDFALSEFRVAVGNELDGEKDRQKKMEDEMKDLIKAEERSTKKINEDNRSIDRAKNDIVANQGDQQRQADLISNQKGLVESTKDNPDANKDAIKGLKDLESTKKKLEKQNEKLNKDIDGWNKEIREEQRKIEASRNDQKLKSGQIEKQKQVVVGVQDKLSNIK
jgi:hypothetical protein